MEQKIVKKSVLVTWIAVNNDPFERERGEDEYKLINGKPKPGPTLTVLLDEQSPFAGNIADIVLLHREVEGTEATRELRAVRETVSVLGERISTLKIHHEIWHGDDPTDHRAIFEFLTEAIPRIRRRFVGREILIHISPGTPSMQTIWVLMAETGFVEPPFKLIKSYRKEERRGRPAVVPVELGIETFYKVYKSTRPRQIASEDQSLLWDPAKFKTEKMRRLFVEARRFAQLNVPVLVLGERGTGKTTLASWMRLHSPFHRKEQDTHWPAVACGQYSPETMRAELFGYKKGSFTGATRDSKGLLATADKDTLFLDEIGDVSRDLQRLLIKALEEKQYVPLGEDRPRKSDFRLLAATNLERSELARRLDPDFLDRISMLSLTLPPLREIGEEIPWLWENVFRHAAQRAGVRQRKSVLRALHHHRVIAVLQQHPLPGNLRDLFRLAYRILAARCDPHEPLDPQSAVDYALAGFNGNIRDSRSHAAVSMSVARAFSDARPLDSIVSEEGCIRTKVVEREFKSYLANELRRISKARGIPVHELCDVTERSLRSWSSTSKKDASE